MSGRSIVRTQRGAAVALLFLLVVLVPTAARATDAEEAFTKGTKILSLQMGGGAQNGIETPNSGITFLNFTPRLSYLPFDPFGQSWYKVALEPGLEGWVQYYMGPQQAAAGGLKTVGRLHALGFGWFVPYLELTAGAGATGLDLPESKSTFTFILEGGAGFSIFVKPDLAFTVGYRFQHMSNGNTSKPNKGYEADSGTIGLSYFFK